MKIGIIGAGFTGLGAAFSLTKKGHEVSIFEKDAQPGGLALGYQKPEWEWTLEAYYHHWFTNDTTILSLAKEIHYPIVVKRPKTSVFVEGKNYQLDSPSAFFTFPKLQIWDRLRMIETLGLLRINPFWKPMEKVKASEYLPKAMGEKAYKLIWEPQLTNKFGDYAEKISLAWFWARIVKRTPSLVYPRGGFLEFAKEIQKAIEEKGGKFFYNASVSEIKKNKDKIIVSIGKEKYEFDKVIVTLPSFPFLKLCPSLPEDYKEKLKKLEGLGAMTVILRLKKQFMTDNTYWLSICDPAAPITAVVEHTNFMNKKHYNNEHLVYLGNYLPHNHPYFSLSEKEILKEFDHLLQQLHPNYEKDIIGIDIFKTPFAQPIVPINYSKIKPPFDTPLEGIYLANIQQVYPWDRGTNYAVELGQKVVDYILK